MDLPNSEIEAELWSVADMDLRKSEIEGLQYCGRQKLVTSKVSTVTLARRGVTTCRIATEAVSLLCALLETASSGSYRCVLGRVSGLLHELY